MATEAVRQHPYRHEYVIRCTYRPNNECCSNTILLPQFYLDGRIVCYDHWCKHLISEGHPPLCVFKSNRSRFYESSYEWKYYATCTKNIYYKAEKHHDECRFASVDI